MIKMAMIAIHHRLKGCGLRAQMLLQIHDELIFEVHAEDLTKMADLVREEMTTVMPLSVPLKVDVKTGENWAGLRTDRFLAGVTMSATNFMSTQPRHRHSIPLIGLVAASLPAKYGC